MIRRIQVLNYRCLRHLDVEPGRRMMVTGPVGGGKSTLIGVLGFLRDLVRQGPRVAVARRADDFRDLVWGRPGEEPGFELAVEFEIPAESRDHLPPGSAFEVYRYEVALRGDGDGVSIHTERGILSPVRESPDVVQPSFFPHLPKPPGTILASSRPGSRTVLSKTPGGTDRFYRERDPEKGWVTEIPLGPLRSALGTLPDSPAIRPVTTAIKRMLETGVTRIRPDVRAMRRPSPPGQPEGVLLEGASNLPWVVSRLRRESAKRFEGWLSLLRAAVPGLEDVRVARREADRYGYLVLRFSGGLEAPSWIVSDGTLHLLAFTVPPFLSSADRVFLIDDPERALPASGLSAFHEAFSATQSQLLATTSSPELLDLFSPQEVLSLARREDGVIGVAGSDAADEAATAEAADTSGEADGVDAADTSGDADCVDAADTSGDTGNVDAADADANAECSATSDEP